MTQRALSRRDALDRPRPASRDAARGCHRLRPPCRQWVLVSARGECLDQRQGRWPERCRSETASPDHRRRKRLPRWLFPVWRFLPARESRYSQSDNQLSKAVLDNKIDFDLFVVFHLIEFRVFDDMAAVALLVPEINRNVIQRGDENTVG